MTLLLESVAAEQYISPIPQAALNAGYTTRTYGPGVTLGSNWYLFNFLNVTPVAGASLQNADGSVTLTSSGSPYYSSNICTAQQQPGRTWSGTAFGGGAYFEGVCSFTGAPQGANTFGHPAFWGLSVEHLVDPTLPPWPGQPGIYLDFVELDIMEYNSGTLGQYTATAHSWYAGNPLQDVRDTSLISIQEEVFTTYLTYGCLWIPATASTQGSFTWYYRNHQVGHTIVWNQYNSANAPPPIAGSTAWSVLDVQHLCPIFGLSNTLFTMNVASMSVWQASTAGNLVQ